MNIKWEFNPGSKVQAPLYYFEDYVISDWVDYFILSYRPTGQHYYLGKFNCLKTAQIVAEKHFLDKNSVKE